MTSNGTKTCLDLFAGLGGFSSAFEDHPEWEVITVEIDPDLDADVVADVGELTPSDPRLPDDVDVILASPPCTQFSKAGNHDQWDFDNRVPTGDDARDAVALVYHTIGLIKGLTPNYWLLENPRGRLRWVLGDPVATVTYCQYGKGYQKPTDLWGRHPPGIDYRSCPRGGDCHASNSKDDGTEAVASMPSDRGVRSLVPSELSEEILTAVEGRSRQTTLTGGAVGSGEVVISD